MRTRLAHVPAPLWRPLRRFLWRHPTLYRPMARWQLCPEALREDFDCWLDGYPRSGNTFAARVLQEVLPAGKRLRTHTHHPALIAAAVRRGRPGIFVIRAPRDCALSWALFAGKPVGELLDYYTDFHRALLPLRDRMLVAPFAEVTRDFGRVVDRFRARFGVECRAFDHTAEAAERIFDGMESLQRERRRDVGVDELTIWRPSAERDALKAQLARELDHCPRLQQKLRDAEAVYRGFVPDAAPAAASFNAPARTTAPTLLILTPTLGRSPFLDATIASIRALDVPKQVVLVCPAGKMAELRARYPDFAVAADAGREGGIYGALNAGLAAAKPGWDWFTYINDDDLLAPGFAALVRRHCRPENAGFVAYGDIGLLDGNDRSLGRMTIEKNPAYFAALLQDGISPVGQQGMVFSAPVVRALGGYRLAYRLCADLDFWARAHAAGTQFRHYPLNVGQFRIQPGQLSGDVTLTRREQDEITRRCYPRPVSKLGRRLARWRYRLHNAPRYLARWRAVGSLTSSDEMLGRSAELLPPDAAPSTSH